jgi:hypothetical protein
MILPFTGAIEANWTGINGPLHRLRSLAMLEAVTTLRFTTRRPINMRVQLVEVVHHPRHLLSTVTSPMVHRNL